jgi:hypothetical protein
MSGKKNMKSKQQTMVENSNESKVVAAPAVAVAAPAVAVAAPVVAAAESKQKGGRKKASSVESTTPVVVQAVVPVVPVAESVAAPVAEKKQRGSRKKVEAPVVEAKVETKVPKSRAKAAAVSQTSDKPVKAKVQRKKKSDVSEEAVAAVAEAVEGSDEKHIRSFKVKLPGSESFEGRFTGLTPYQAANKALSKYFREGERTDNDVTFSICESTRKSKKSVYTYVGKRHQLEVPVKYTIQDGREIVKNFKNTLKKVKKSENLTLAPPTETSVNMGASA